jgi:hypothetical protein
MSGISDLARSFEERSKQQASAIETSVANAYAQHEQTLLRALQSSEGKLSAAIQARETSLSELLSTTEASTRALALSGWKWLAGSLLAVALASSGALWWTSQTLAENLALIEQQKATMARAQALGVQFHQDANGQFIVLPRGMKPVTGWTFDNGHRQAIKLEK